MLERKVTVDTIQLGDDGTLLVRLKKRTIINGEVLKEEWHRTSIPPGTDPVAQIDAVTMHLATMGYEAPPVANTALLRAVAEAVHTPEVKAAYVAKARAAELAPKSLPIAELVKL